MDTLEQQYEKCELTKLDVGDMCTPDLGQVHVQEFPDLTIFVVVLNFPCQLMLLIFTQFDTP